MLLAIGAILDRNPDLVLSGVNHGQNLGEDVLYSGTVAAAMEATLLGIPAIAISFAGEESSSPSELYLPVLRRLLTRIVEQHRFTGGTLLNVNIPDVPPGDIRGVRVTTLGRRVYFDSLSRRSDPQGREYYWIGGGYTRWSGREDSDFRAIGAGYISVTPIHLDMTHYGLVEEFANWDLTLDRPDSTGRAAGN